MVEQSAAVKAEIAKLEPQRAVALEQRQKEAANVKFWRDVKQDQAQAREAQLRFNKFDERFRDFDTRIKLLEKSSTIKEFGEKFTGVREVQRVSRTRAIDIREFRRLEKAGEGKIIRREGAIVGFQPRTEPEPIETFRTRDLPARTITQAEARAFQARKEAQRAQRGAIFLTPQELSRRDVSRDVGGLVTSQERKAMQDIQRAEEIIRVPEGVRERTGFIIPAGVVEQVKTREGEFISAVGKDIMKGIAFVDTLGGRTLSARIEESGGRLSTGFVPITPIVSIPRAPTGVSFVGAKQTISPTAIRTTQFFRTDEGLLGKAVSISRIKPIGQKLFVSRTVTGGGLGKPAFQIPTGKFKLLRPKTFVSLETSVGTLSPVKLTKEIGIIDVSKILKGSAAISRGKVVATVGRAKTADIFKTISGSIKAEKEIFTGGFTGTFKGSQILGTGVTREIPRVIKISRLGKPSVQVSRKLLTVQQREALDVALKTGQVQIQAGVGRAQTIVPVEIARAQTLAGIGTVSIKQVPRLETPSIVQAIKTIPIQQPKQFQTISQTISQVQPQKVGLDSIQPSAVRQLTKLQTAQVSALAQPVAQKISAGQALKITPTVTQRFAQIPKPLIIQKQITTGVPFIGVPIVPSIPPPVSPPMFPRFKGLAPSIPKIKGTFGVSIRRRGEFRPIGAGLTLPKAISVGQQRAEKTLAATFKITPERKGQQIGGIRTPKGFKRKKGLIFIEQPKLRLSAPSEIKEIQIARRIKT